MVCGEVINSANDALILVQCCSSFEQSCDRLSLEEFRRIGLDSNGGATGLERSLPDPPLIGGLSEDMFLLGSHLQSVLSPLSATKTLRLSHLGVSFRALLSWQQVRDSEKGIVGVLLRYAEQYYKSILRGKAQFCYWWKQCAETCCVSPLAGLDNRALLGVFCAESGVCWFYLRIFLSACEIASVHVRMGRKKGPLD